MGTGLFSRVPTESTRGNRHKLYDREKVKQREKPIICGHQVLEPGGHRGSARDRRSVPAMTEPKSTDKPPEAGIGMPWFSFSGKHG